VTTRLVVSPRRAFLPSQSISSLHRGHSPQRRASSRPQTMSTLVPLAEDMSSLVWLLTSQYAPIQSAMQAHLDVDEIISISRTCKALNPLWKIFIDTAFNIYFLLRGYFNDTKAFRSLQANHGVLIFGGSARQFLSRIPVDRLELSIGHLHVPVIQTNLISEGYTATRNTSV
jgi:hypothetical protein